MNIRRATASDTAELERLLYQVQKIHADARPDIFRKGAKKYSANELREIIDDDTRPIFVACDCNEGLLGYCFCILEDIKGSENLSDRKTLYIDDLCVDENMRKKQVGRSLFEHVTRFAQDIGCDGITLNVWCLNRDAMIFYEKLGLSPLKITMEKTL